MRGLIRTAILFLSTAVTLAMVVSTAADDTEKLPPQAKTYLFIASGDADQVAAFFEMFKKEYLKSFEVAQCVGPFDPPAWYAREHKPNNGTKGSSQTILCFTPTKETFAALGQVLIDLSQHEGQVMPQSDLVLTALYTCTYYVCSGQRKLYRTGAACTSPC